MKRAMVLAAIGAIAAFPSKAEERRELGAHEHGHSVLNIAIQGDRVEMELMAPGMDIVGFEHPAGTEQQEVALAQAETALADPLALFVLPAEAGCMMVASDVALETEEEHEHEKHEDTEEADHEEEGHAEFHASYSITCEAPDHLGGITFAFFERFPGAQEIDVTIITESGQTRSEVERDAPRIDLKRLI